MATIATLDLKSIHELYQEVKKEYSGYSERCLSFLATWFYLDPDLDLDIALKLRTYGGLINLDNSTLDKYFKSYRILRLHAILHDASAFALEHIAKGPIYSCILPWPVTNEYHGRVAGIALCLYVKFFKKNLFSLLECWNCDQLFLILKAFDIKNWILYSKSFLYVLIITAILFLFYPQVPSIYFPQVNKSLTSGFQNFFMVWLGRAELPLLLFATKYSKHQTSFSFCRILCKRNWKSGHFEEVTPKRRYQFGDVVMAKGWIPKIILRHINLWTTCSKLSQTTTKLTLCYKEGQIVLPSADERVVVWKNQLLLSFK